MHTHPVTPSHPPYQTHRPTGALRYGYFAGGDREYVTRLDLRRAAGFVRHGDAHVTNCLLPLQVTNPRLQPVLWDGCGRRLPCLQLTCNACLQGSL